MRQRRKARIAAAVLVAVASVGVLVGTAAADNVIPVDTGWGKDRQFTNRYEFELVCQEIGGKVGRYWLLDTDTLYCEKNPIHGSPEWWYWIPGLGLIGGQHWFTYSGPDAHPDWAGSRSRGGGGSW